MMKQLLRLPIILTCVFTLLNAIMFVAISVYRSVHAYVLIFQGKIEERPGIHLVEALDGFLLAFVFIVFAIGFGKLFLPDNVLLRSIQLSWLQPKDFSDLKHILWEAVLTTLVVIAAISVVQNINSLQWSQLIIPGCIVLIAVASKLLSRSH